MVRKMVASGLLLMGTGWETYVNQRFGFHVDYPAALVAPQEEAGNGDGRHFKARTGTADFAAWGGYLADAGSFAEGARLSEADCAGGKATYKLQRETVWVLSCPLAKGGVFYGKCLRRKDAQACFEARYPVAEKSVWDAVAGRMAGSLSLPALVD